MLSSLAVTVILMWFSTSDQSLRGETRGVRASAGEERNKRNVRRVETRYRRSTDGGRERGDFEEQTRHCFHCELNEFGFTPAARAPFSPRGG